MLMITLSAEEKRAMCSKLAAELPKIRELLGATQEGFGELCGLSRITISRIENGSARMNWSHLTSVMSWWSATAAPRSIFMQTTCWTSVFCSSCSRRTLTSRRRSTSWWMWTVSGPMPSGNKIAAGRRHDIGHEKAADNAGGVFYLSDFRRRDICAGI